MGPTAESRANSSQAPRLEALYGLAGEDGYTAAAIVGRPALSRRRRIFRPVFGIEGSRERDLAARFREGAEPATCSRMADICGWRG